MPIQKAKEILSDFWDGKLPVSPKDIAQKLGIIVRLCFGAESGKAYLDNNVKVIEYKDTEPLVRQRFTIAHEMGHHLLGHTTLAITAIRFSFYDQTEKTKIRTLV